MVKIVIEIDADIDDEFGIDHALDEVQRLLSNGFTSGYEPRWYIEED